MKNIILLAACILMISLTGCAPSFGGGGWLVQVICFVPAVICIYYSVKKHKGGYGYFDQQKIWHSYSDPVPYTKIGQFWFALLLIAVGIGSIIWMAYDK